MRIRKRITRTSRSTTPGLGPPVLIVILLVFLFLILILLLLLILFRRPPPIHRATPVDTISRPVIPRHLSGRLPTGENARRAPARANETTRINAMSDATTPVAALKDGIRRFAADRGWDPYHTPKNLAMALASEVGELCEMFRWLTPEESVAAASDPKTAGGDRRRTGRRGQHRVPPERAHRDRPERGGAGEDGEERDQVPGSGCGRRVAGTRSVPATNKAAVWGKCGSGCRLRGCSTSRGGDEPCENDPFCSPGRRWRRAWPPSGRSPPSGRPWADTTSRSCPPPAGRVVHAVDADTAGHRKPAAAPAAHLADTAAHQPAREPPAADQPGDGRTGWRSPGQLRHAAAEHGDAGGATRCRAHCRHQASPSEPKFPTRGQPRPSRRNPVPLPPTGGPALPACAIPPAPTGPAAPTGRRFHFPRPRRAGCWDSGVPLAPPGTHRDSGLSPGSTPVRPLTGATGALPGRTHAERDGRSRLPRDRRFGQRVPLRTDRQEQPGLRRSAGRPRRGRTARPGRTTSAAIRPRN